MAINVACYNQIQVFNIMPPKLYYTDTTGKYFCIFICLLLLYKGQKVQKAINFNFKRWIPWSIYSKNVTKGLKIAFQTLPTLEEAVQSDNVKTAILIVIRYFVSV